MLAVAPPKPAVTLRLHQTSSSGRRDPFPDLARARSDRRARKGGLISEAFSGCE
jgi:hypothetical protein